MATECETGEACLRSAGATASATEAARLYQRACELGSAAGCTRLGDAYALGSPGFSRDPTTAADLWALACGDDDAVGCGRAAKAYHLGEGVVRDDKRAQGYLDRGCRLGAQAQCAPLEVFVGNRRAEGTLREAVVAQIEEIRGCYNLALLADPAIAGRVEIVMEVGADGGDRRLTIDGNDTGDPELAECILGIVATVAVDARQPMRETFSFVLRPSHAAPHASRTGEIVVQGGPTAPRGSGAQP